MGVVRTALPPTHPLTLPPLPARITPIPTFDQYSMAFKALSTSVTSLPVQAWFQW